MSRGQIPSTLLARTYPRPPMSTNPSASRSCSLRNPPGTDAAGDVPGRRDGAAVAPCQVGGQLLAAPEYRLGQAVAYVAFAAPPRRRQRALIGDDVRDNTHSQRRIAKGQKCLPVQPADVTLVEVPAAARAGRDEGTNRAVVTRSGH
jgi:hypothetical protein